MKVFQGMSDGENSEMWLETLKAKLDKEIAANGVESEGARKARIFIVDHLLDKKEYAEVRLMIEPQWEIDRQALGDNDWRTILSESRLALALLAIGESEQSRGMLVHIYDTRKSAFGEDHKDAKWAANLIEIIDSQKS
jgi:hypothetical protein